MTRRKKLFILFDVIMISILVAIDQWTKQWAIRTLKEQPDIPIIEGILELSYLENRGAAFGMLQNQKYFFILITIVVVTLIVFLIFKLPDDKKYNPLHFCLLGILSGAVGNNLFDRVSYHYVIDFIYVKVINFPIFNMADIYVCVATFFLCIYLLFVYKESDLYFISFKEKKYRTFDQ
ncbi:MAG: signal peptidase II [Eubacteriales bacterium]